MQCIHKSHSSSGIQAVCTPLWLLWCPSYCCSQSPTSHWHTPPLFLRYCLLHQSGEYYHCCNTEVILQMYIWLCSITVRHTVTLDTTTAHILAKMVQILLYSQTWHNVTITEYSSYVVFSITWAHTICTVQQMWLIAITIKVGEVNVPAQASILWGTILRNSTYRNSGIATITCTFKKKTTPKECTRNLPKEWMR